MDKVVIYIELTKDERLPLGHAIFGGDYIEYDWSYKMGNITEYIPSLDVEIFMLGFYAIAYNEYAVHFQVMNNGTGDITDYVGVTSDFTIGDKEWVIPLCEDDNPRETFINILHNC